MWLWRPASQVCIHLPRKDTILFPLSPPATPCTLSSALVSCLPIQGHNLFSDEKVVLTLCGNLPEPCADHMGRKRPEQTQPKWEKAGLWERFPVRSHLWPLLFPWASTRSAGGPNFPISPSSWRTKRLTCCNNTVTVVDMDNVIQELAWVSQVWFRVGFEVSKSKHSFRSCRQKSMHSFSFLNCAYFIVYSIL